MLFLKVLQNAQEIPVLKSLFNKYTGLYSVSLMTEKYLIHMLSDKFCRIFKTSFLQKTSSQLLLFYENLF